jgi:hypothetical protein
MPNRQITYSGSTQLPKTTQRSHTGATATQERKSTRCDISTMPRRVSTFRTQPPEIFAVINSRVTTMDITQFFPDENKNPQMTSLYCAYNYNNCPRSTIPLILMFKSAYVQLIRPEGTKLCTYSLATLMYITRGIQFLRISPHKHFLCSHTRNTRHHTQRPF